MIENKYGLIPKQVLTDLDRMRNRNPVHAGAADTNAVMVEIGKNLIVDYIFDMFKAAVKGTPLTTEAPVSGSDIVMGEISTIPK